IRRQPSGWGTAGWEHSTGRMTHRFSCATVLLVVALLTTRTAAAENHDLRALLSKAKHPLFAARIAGVTFRPGPLMTLSGSNDRELIEAVSYWLQVGAGYERRLGIHLDSADDVLRLTIIEKNPILRDIPPAAWASIAIAKAATGNYRAGAEMLEVQSTLYL